MTHMQVIRLAIFIGISVLFTGCQSSSNVKKEVAMGRYLEEKIEFESINNEEINRTIFFENKEGNIEALSSKLGENETDIIYKCYAPGDDNLWKETDEALSRAIDSEHLYVLDSIQKDKKTGELYLIGGTGEEEEMKGAEAISVEDLPQVTPYVARIKEDGTLEQVAIDWKTTADLSFEAKVDQDNLFILAGSTDVIQQYDLKTGKLVKEIGENIRIFTVLKDQIYAFNGSDQSVIECYDIKTGKLTKSIKTVVEGYCNNMITADDEKGIYFINQEGIYYLAENEEIAEQVLDGDRYALSSPRSAIMSAYMYKDIFYIGLILDDGYAYRQYTYHDNIPLVPEKTLTIFSLEDCTLLKEAAQIYMEKHPDVYVDFNIMSSNGGSIDREAKRQAVEEINTQILAGDAADIMVLDGLPVESYIEKGILGDMSSIVSEIKKGGSYYDNLMYTYEENDKLYALPLKFTILSAVGESELLKGGFSLEKLADYQRQYPEKQVLGNMVPENLVKMMSSLWYSKIINSDGRVDNEQLAIFLEAVNTLAPMKEGMTDCYYDRNSYLGTRTFQAMDREIKVILEDVSDSNSLQVMMYAKEQLEHGMIAPQIEGEKNLINLQQLIGINAASDKVEEIQELLTIAFSKEILGRSYGNLTLEKETAESMLLGENTRKVIGSGEAYKMKDDGIDFARIGENGEMEIKNIPKWYTEDAKYYINNLKDAKALKPMDGKILSIIQKESEDYFKGNISVNEAVQHIGEKVEIYLSEQNK